MEKDRLIEFDGLKGLAACLVAYMSHYKGSFQVVPHNPFISFFFEQGGYIGNSLFFMISGFIFYHSYGYIIRQRKIEFKTYLKKRIMRLYPLMILTTLITAILQWSHMLKIGGGGYKRGNNDVYYLTLNLLGLQSGWFGASQSFNAPSWFISVLIMCYIIFWFIIRYSPSSEVEFASFCITIIIGIYFVHNSKLNFPLLNQHCGQGYMSFFIGSLLSKSGFLINRDYKKIKNLCAFFIIGGIYLISVSTIHFIGDAAVVYAVWLVPSILLLGLQWNLLSAFLRTKIIQNLGKISFSIYLWNFPTDLIWIILFRIVGWDVNYSAYSVYGLHLLVSIIIALCSYRYFECPTAKWIKLKIKGVD